MRERIQAHYAQRDLVAAIRDGLRRAGKDIDGLVPADLAAVDEFHVRGRQATLEMAERLGLDATMRVLDVGSGIGGPSRLLAAEYGCRVTGIDLTKEYCRAAAAIASWIGLDDLVEYRQGDALDLPFEDNVFDVAWTQHVAMNVADKAAMYREVRRVLRSGGAFAIYDVLEGAGGDVLYPAPWARDASISFLVTAGELRELVTDAGFRIASWRDTTAAGRDWLREVTRRLQDRGPPPLGFHLLVGADYAQMAENQRRNLEDDRIALIEAVCRAP